MPWTLCGSSRNSSDSFFQWTNGNIMKLGRFELGRSCGGIQCAAQVSSKGLRTQFLSSSGPCPMAAPLKRKKFLCHCSCCSFSLVFLCPCKSLVNRENTVSAFPVRSKACPCPVCPGPTSATAAAAGHGSMSLCCGCAGSSQAAPGPTAARREVLKFRITLECWSPLLCCEL